MSKDTFTDCVPTYLPGTRGREKGEFTNLQGISASSNGRVVVADSNNQCIQVRCTQRGISAHPRTITQGKTILL